MTDSFQSCIYEGIVRHRRLSPRPNDFTYSLYHLYLDLDELPRLFDKAWLWSARRPAVAWFRREDHVGDPAVPLAETIRALVERETGTRPSGPIRLLTHLRYFGYVFNPVSFYYCFDPSGENLETIVAEVHNTPWNELHCYVLPAGKNVGTPQCRRFRFAKDFHVSPFMDMDIGYDWRFTPPGKSLGIHMENWKDGALVFDATMNLRRVPIGAGSLARVLVHYPLMTGKVIAAIYWQALRLWWKGTPFHPHPSPAPPPAGEVLPR